MEKLALQDGMRRKIRRFRLLRRYLIDPADAPAWMRSAFRVFPARLITLATILSGCVAPTPTGIAPADDTVWETLAPGLERRSYRPGGDYALTQLVAVRIDPAYYSFRVHYRPGDPLSVSNWQNALPGAVAFVNGNFFDGQNTALGLVVADGVAYGQAYQGLGGMLQVQDNGVRVRSTILEPYAGEPLQQAVQAFPMLITNGQPFTNTDGDRISRRTVAAQDTQGRIVLLVTSSLVGMRLVDLAAYLVASDLALVNAVNLDGGGSTLLSLTVPGRDAYTVQSVDPVPTVLAVYPR